MTNRSKIVGITQDPSDAPSRSVDSDAPASFIDDHLDDDFAENHQVNVGAQNENSTEYYDEYVTNNPSISSWTHYIAPIFLTVLMIGWTVFFGWVNQTELLAITPVDAVRLISEWAVPAALIGVTWLLILRSSRSETNRFSDAALKLRNESEALEIKMRTVNEEIAVAREFLAQNSRELESVGRQSAARLIEAAEKIGVALNDSEAKAKILEQVSNAATINLDQLRKHLPVVTSAAKDVTNQIGGAGNSAQLQVKSLIAALQRVSAAGVEARDNIAQMVQQAAQSSEGMSQRITDNAAFLQTAMEQSSEQMKALTAAVYNLMVELSSRLEKGSTDTVDKISGAATDLTRKLNDNAAKVSEYLEQSSSNFAAKIAINNGDIDQMVERNLAKLTTQAAALNQSLAIMESKVATEDARSRDMITRINEHLAERSQQVIAIDEDAAQRSAKLAFALEALVETSVRLMGNLTLNSDTARVLTERSEHILALADAANTRLAETLPAALSQADQHISGSLTHIEQAKQQASGLEEYGSGLLSKLNEIEGAIAARRGELESFIAASGGSLSGSQQQADALSESLLRAQALIGELAQIKDEGLIETLDRVQENIRIGILQSRKMMEAEMEGLTARLSEESQNSLKSAVEEQVNSVDRIMNETIQANITLSNSAAEKLNEQLAHIESMTSNLERRLDDARSEFAGIDDDSFARQMALLTESLNSTAIDVTKILSNEVTDTSWAAYLKGDRGVFTRRAVRLLDSGEAKTIASHYDEDAEFRAHVNRYVHDFESMMRALLSTRDGNAIGVTLLSSDVGKLYVALAQAIERLRNN